MKSSAERHREGEGEKKNEGRYLQSMSQKGQAAGLSGHMDIHHRRALHQHL